MSAVFLEISLPFYLDVLFVDWFICFPTFPGLPGTQPSFLHHFSLSSSLKMTWDLDTANGLIYVKIYRQKQQNRWSKWPSI